MTYSELARARGISKSSAERLVFRNRWRRQRGNNGITRAFVPMDSLTGDASGGAPPVETPDTTGDIGLTARALATLEDALSALREAKDGEIATLHAVIEGLRNTIARTEDRAARAEQRADAERAKAEELDGRLSAEGTRAEQFRAAAEEALRVAAAAQIAQAEAEVDAAELRIAAEQARAEAQEDRAAAEALRQVEAVRQASGRWARLRAAWRGE